MKKDKKKKHQQQDEVNEQKNNNNLLDIYIYRFVEAIISDNRTAEPNSWSWLLFIYSVRTLRIYFSN